MDDLISRQAAIDFVDAGYLVNPNEPRWSDNEVVAFLKSRPSVQPQPVVRCKDCRYQDKGCNESESWNLCGYRPWLHVPTEDEHYCGYAERRTDVSK